MQVALNKTKVYLDTSVISYLEQKDAPEQMQITRNVWDTFKSGKYDIYISDVVIRELSKCSDSQKRALLLSHLDEIDYKLVDVTHEVFAFAEQMIDFGILKKKSFDDCQHIAAAVISNCDVIISWNFKHIVNYDTIKGIKILTTTEGYKDILIYSPEVFQSEREDENGS
ncbi:MAG: type II toxin-antitoxin system VapC family toxin [Treponema sp.]|nr:type II toxin-antitoxin system VapC family toxin [Treponema sp.]